MKNIKLIFLFLIIFLAAFLRFYKLDQIPSSLNWDEVAAGYNAYTIANWGMDEYGNKFPLVFKNFGDDKHPVHIYATAIFTKIFGLNDYSTRSSSALVGVLSVVVIYFLVKKILDDDVAALFSALFLSISPYALQFSRGLWEANFALFFFVLGLYLFYKGVEKKNWQLPISFVAFGLSFFSYHSSKIIVPPLVLLVCLFNIRKVFESKKILVMILLIGLMFGRLIMSDQRILGFARAKQTSFSEDTLKKYGGWQGTVSKNYKQYFTYEYLFKTGDQSPRASVKVIGEFYKIDLVLVLLGSICLFIKRKWQLISLLFLWLLLSPIPGALSTTEPSATRGIFMVGPIIILSGIGASFTISLFKNKLLKTFFIASIVLIVGYEFSNYINYYYTSYNKKDAIEWQYGMKQIVNFIKRNPEYSTVYMDKIRQQPYIFFLYYLKTPLPELLKSVSYDTSESKSFNTVKSFGRYHFGDWDIVNSYPGYGLLYAITPSYYTGLRYINLFNVNYLIKYPDGSDAFYLVSGNQ